MATKKSDDSIGKTILIAIIGAIVSGTFTIANTIIGEVYRNRSVAPTTSSQTLTAEQVQAMIDKAQSDKKLIANVQVQSEQQTWKSPPKVKTLSGAPDPGNDSTTSKPNAFTTTIKKSYDVVQEFFTNKGTQLYVYAILLSVLAISVGFILWHFFWPKKKKRAKT